MPMRPVPVHAEPSGALPSKVVVAAAVLHTYAVPLASIIAVNVFPDARLAGKVAAVVTVKLATVVTTTALPL
jgi:hypothetical protein